MTSNTTFIEYAIGVNQETNEVHDNFFLAHYANKFLTYTFQVHLQDYLPNEVKSQEDYYLMLILQQGQERTLTKWEQIYINDFLSEIGGLFTAFWGVINFFLSSYQDFVYQKSLLKRLYGEEGGSSSSAADESSSDEGDTRLPPSEQLQKKMEKRKDFRASYCLQLLVPCFKAICCCFV